MGPRHILSLGLATTLAIAVAACGGDDDGTPTAPSGNTGAVAATITIGADGAVTPRDVTVPAGSRVTFVNNHVRSHEMASDPHPTHGSCPPLDQVGFMAPNQSRTSGNLNTPGTCRYHDHLESENDAMKGTIRVQ